MKSSVATVLGFAAGVSVGVALAAPTVHALKRTPIIGVWAFVSETNSETGQVTHTDKDMDAIWMFTDRFHCVARMERERPVLTTAEVNALPADEKVNYYERQLKYASTAGTYTTSGNTLDRLWQISLGPELIGQHSVAPYSADGNQLSVELPRRSAASGPAMRVVYRRLE
jgi:hypothetical protein